MKKVCKGLIAINDLLDDRYQKLCDKYHDLELSHNRKRKALNRLCSMFVSVLNEIDSTGKPWVWNSPAVEFVIQICADALFSDGRCNCRPIVKKSKKGGAI